MCTTFRHLAIGENKSKRNEIEECQLIVLQLLLTNNKFENRESEKREREKGDAITSFYGLETTIEEKR